MPSNDKVTLRAPIDSDLDVLGEIRNDPEIQFQLMARMQPNPPHRVKEWIDHRCSEPTTIFFVIALPNSEPCGFLQVTNIDEKDLTATFGICLARHARGRGLADASLALIERHLVQRRSLRKLKLEVLESNARAIELYNRCGYRRVGVLEKEFFYDEVAYNVVIMEKLLLDN